MSVSVNISAASSISGKTKSSRKGRETIQNLQAETVPHADLADRASTEAERQLELRTRDRQRKLIAKIDSALRRIEDGSYGFCEETGEPISLKRLDARPIATLSIEAQERHERARKGLSGRLELELKRPDRKIRLFIFPPLMWHAISPRAMPRRMIYQGIRMSKSCEPYRGCCTSLIVPWPP